MNRESFAQNCTEIGIQLNGLQVDAFDSFESALFETNASRNLTRIARDDCWIRHFLDSLLFHDLFPSGSRVLDIGCGPGFPSWPLACARPDLQVVALDSSSKYLGFLRQHSLPNLEIIEGRSEDFRHPDPFDFVTGRALAPLSIQLELSAHWCRIGGAVIPMRTRGDLEEIDRLAKNPFGLKLSNVVTRTLPVALAPRVAPVFLRELAGSKQFPRKWAEIRKNPI